MQWILIAMGLGLMLLVRIRRVRPAVRLLATLAGTGLLMCGILFQPLVWMARDVDLSIDEAVIEISEPEGQTATIHAAGRVAHRWAPPDEYRIVLYVRSGLDLFTPLSPAVEITSVWSWTGEVRFDSPYDPEEIHVLIARLVRVSDLETDDPPFRVESMPRLLVRETAVP